MERAGSELTSVRKGRGRYRTPGTIRYQVSEANDTVSKGCLTAMLTLVAASEGSPVVSSSPVSSYTKADGQFEVISKVHPDARVFLDHGVFFVGVQTEYGRLILGWGETVKKAVDAAVLKAKG